MPCGATELEIKNKVKEMTTKGPKLIAPSFTAPGGNLKLVAWLEGTFRPRLKELKSEIMPRKPGARQELTC